MTPVHRPQFVLCFWLECHYFIQIAEQSQQQQRNQRAMTRRPRCHQKLINTLIFETFSVLTVNKRSHCGRDKRWVVILLQRREAVRERQKPATMSFPISLCLLQIVSGLGREDGKQQGSWETWSLSPSIICFCVQIAVAVKCAVSAKSLICSLGFQWTTNSNYNI